jgi:hypothetical protein
MANTNAPFGVRMLNGTGSAANYQIEYMAIASNDSTKIYRGALRRDYTHLGAKSRVLDRAP